MLQPFVDRDEYCKKQFYKLDVDNDVSQATGEAQTVDDDTINPDHEGNYCTTASARHTNTHAGPSRTREQ